MPYQTERQVLMTKFEHKSLEQKQSFAGETSRRGCVLVALDGVVEPEVRLTAPFPTIFYVFEGSATPFPCALFLVAGIPSA